MNEKRKRKALKSTGVGTRRVFVPLSWHIAVFWGISLNPVYVDIHPLVKGVGCEDHWDCVYL